MIKKFDKEKFNKRLCWFMIATGLLMLGAISNFKVQLKNDCRMPIKGESNYVVNDEYLSFNDKEQVNYWLLGDIIGNEYVKASIGDVLMFFGMIISGFSLTLLFRELKKL